MDSLAPLFFLALSLFFHVGIILPLLSGWLYSNTRPQPAPPPISVRMAAPRQAPPLPVTTNRPRASAPVSQAAPRASRPGGRTQSVRRQALTAPGSVRQVAASPTAAVGNYPTYPQGRGRGGPGPGQDEPGLPSQPGGPAAPSATSEPVMQEARVTGLPRTILVPSFLQKQEARNFVITFEVRVGPDGSAQVRVYQGSGCTGLDQMLTAELSQMRWLPATRDGQAVASSFHISVSGDFRKGCENFTLSQTPGPGSGSQN